MKFIDLQQQYQRIESQIKERINDVLTHGQFILGKEVKECEQRLADFVGMPHCIGLSSGTSALELAMMALDIGSGDEVITTPFSFYATAEMIVRVGATPVFVDIDERTYNIDPALIEAAITDKTKAILTVDLYGQCADYKAISEIAKRHKLFLIEDAAQSFGGKQGDKMACSFGDVSCTSFFPAKPLGCYGDAGACFTHNEALATRIRRLSNHGQVSRYNHVDIGTTARLDTMQAAILLAKLDIFADEVESRQQVAAWYAEALSAEEVPYVAAENISAWAQYTLMHSKRDAFQEHMKKHNIPTAIHYPRTFLQIEALSPHLSSNQKPCPKAEKAANEVISLPFHPYMTQEQVLEIAEKIRSFSKA